jgi:DNA-binding NarL/FixJ family response regulator
MTTRYSAAIINPLEFTGRETEILRLLCVGYSDKAIAHALDISPSTVATHLQHIYQKLGVRQGNGNSRGVVQCKAVVDGVVKVTASEGDRRTGRDGDRRLKAVR